MASPKKQPPDPAPTSTPHPAAVDSKPVVEPADLTPPASETKVVSSTSPVATPDALISPNHSTPPPENSSPQSKEQKQPSADENVFHPEKEAPVSESIADSTPAVPPSEEEQNSSEKIAGDLPLPEKVPFSSGHQTQSATVSDPPTSEQEQGNSEKSTGDHPHPCAEIVNSDQHAQSAAAEQQQRSSEKTTVDLSFPVVGETQNLLTDAGLDKTAVPAGAETEPNPNIMQNDAVVPLAESKKEDPTEEKHPEVTTNSVEPKPALIPEAVTQETAPIQPDSTDAKVTEEKITEVSAEKPSDDGTANVKCDASAEIIEAEPKMSMSPAEKPDIPEPDKTEQELKLKEAECAEPEHPLVVSDKHPVSASEGKGQANEVKNEPTEKEQEPTLLDVADNSSSPVAQLDGENKAVAKPNEENEAENKVSPKVINEGDATAQRIPEGADEGTSVEIKTHAAVEIATDEERAAEEKANTENTVHIKNDQKPLEENISRELGCTEIAESCPVLDKKESGMGSEPTLTVPEEMPKEEIQVEEEIKTGTKSEPAGESIIETVYLSEKSQEKENTMIEEECILQTQEKQTPEDTALKADNKSDNAEVVSVPPPPDSEEPQAVSIEAAAQRVETALSSAVPSETKVRDEAREVKDFRDESQDASQKTNSVAENQHEAERDTPAGTGSDEKELEKVVELSVKEKEEAKCDKKEDESQPVAGNMRETISVSEAACDKEGAAEFDVGENAISKADEVSETGIENGGVPVAVASALVAQPEIPVSVVSEQDKGQKEENTTMEEKKEPLEKLSDEDARSEVTIVFSSCSGRLGSYLKELLVIIS